MNPLINFFAVSILFGGAVFMATYHVLAPWWRTQVGINVMTFTGAVTGLAFLRCLAFFLGDGYPGQEVMRTLMFAGISVAVWWRWWILLRAQLAPARTPDSVFPEEGR